MQDTETNTETITLPKVEFERIEKLVAMAVEFEKLSEIPAFTREVMGDKTVKEIVVEINYRCMMLVNTELTVPDIPLLLYQDRMVNIAIMLIFLSGTLGVDLVAAINSRMEFERETRQAEQSAAALQTD